MTYYLDLQIMIGYVEVAGDLRTVLWNMAGMFCGIIYDFSNDLSETEA